MTRPNKNKLDNELDMLQGNINRMCITDNIGELRSMYMWANLRINEVFRIRQDEIKEALEMDRLMKAVRL